MALKFAQLPFISFPPELQIKMLEVINNPNSNMSARFAVKKEGAKNIVSVALFNHNDDQSLSEWEIAPLQEFGDGTYGIYNHECSAHVEDTQLLLYSIEKCFDMEVEQD